MPPIMMVQNGFVCRVHTKLFEAAAEGQLETIKQLIAQGADVEATHETGKTILHFAANLEVFKYFFEVHSLNVIEDILLNAAEIGQLELLKYFIEIRGLNPHRLEGGALICAAIPGDHIEVIKYLIEDQCTDVKQTKKNAPLYSALENNNFTLVECLLDQGMRASAAQKILLFAARKCNLKMFECLLQRGACLQEAKGKGVVHYAAKGNNLEVLNYLFTKTFTNNLIAVKYFVVDRKMVIHLKDSWHKSALLIPAENGSLDVVKYLVEECRANVNFTDNLQSNAFLASVSGRHVQKLPSIV